VADSLEPLSASPGGKPRIGLKWPNDLWLSTPQGERKLAGILVETASWEGLRYVVIGIGINIRAVALDAAQAPATPSAPAAIPPGGLQELLPGLDAPATLLRVIPPLVQAVQAFQRFGFAPFQARFAARDVLAGRAVQLSDGTTGTAHGAGENGALLVHTAAGMKEITSSEVSVRPVAAHTPQGARPC
jgi:BirA family biotin operon repressor/biotin-[acetyl-CoA-carboxylase] ligase